MTKTSHLLNKGDYTLYPQKKKALCPAGYIALDKIKQQYHDWPRKLF